MYFYFVLRYLERISTTLLQDGFRSIENDLHEVVKKFLFVSKESLNINRNIVTRHIHPGSCSQVRACDRHATEFECEA